MRDPHIVALQYRLETDEKYLSYDNPPPVEAETPDFRVRLDKGTARFEMFGHHATVKSARELADPYVRAWELDHALRAGQRLLRFVFKVAEIIDRNPPPGESQVVAVEAASVTTLAEGAIAHVTSTRYPDPPERLAVSPDVETLWNRYQAYLEGRETLAAMAYFCLTVWQTLAGGTRSQAASRYCVSKPVLDTLGGLTSKVGDELTGRKYKKGGGRPYTAKEEAWIRAVLLRLIRRTGEWTHDSTAKLAMITMSDLPPL